MKIRLIEPKDLSAIFDLRAVTRENPLSRDELRLMGITEKSTAKSLRTTHRGWLCEDEGKITGFAIGDGQTGELSVIAVLPEYEGQGIGTQLLAEVEGWMASAGRKEFWLWTWSDPKTRAYSFYLNRGWQVSEVKTGVVYMKKILANSAGRTANGL